MMSSLLVVRLVLVLLYTLSLALFSEALSCKGSAKYKFTFQAEWTEKSHPKDFPANNNPHFSPVVGCSHNSSYVMWRPGMLATEGVKEVAELGTTSAINKEIDQQITLGNAWRKFQGGGIGNTGTREVNDIEVNSKYPLVSAISMIFPSPDWFVGVRDFSLCNETTGEWVDKKHRDLPLYDSGTDSAPTFVHQNMPTSPPENIFLIDNTHEGSLKSNDPIKRFGTFTFEKTSGDINEKIQPTSGDTNEKMQPTSGDTNKKMQPTSVATPAAGYHNVFVVFNLLCLSLFVSVSS